MGSVFSGKHFVAVHSQTVQDQGREFAINTLSFLSWKPHLYLLHLTLLTTTHSMSCAGSIAKISSYYLYNETRIFTDFINIIVIFSLRFIVVLNSTPLYLSHHEYRQLQKY